MSMHPGACRKCHRYPFEKCNAKGRFDCPRTTPPAPPPPPPTGPLPPLPEGWIDLRTHPDNAKGDRIIIDEPPPSTPEERRAIMKRWAEEDATVREMPPTAGKAETPKMMASAIAKAKGYTGDSCNDCGNLSMVRNGTCLKCDTCGGTSGCS